MSSPTGNLKKPDIPDSKIEKIPEASKPTKKDAKWKIVVGGIAAIMFILVLIVYLRFTKFKKMKPDDTLKHIEVDEHGNPKTTKT